MVQNGESFGEQEGEEENETNNCFWRIIGKARGICGRNSQTLFWYNINFRVVLGFSSTKHGITL